MPLLTLRFMPRATEMARMVALLARMLAVAVPCSFRCGCGRRDADADYAYAYVRTERCADAGADAARMLRSLLFPTSRCRC
jgi:hypothetical protein